MTIRSENLVAQIEQNKPILQALFDIPAESTINLLNLLKHESGLEATTLNPAKSTQATRMVDLDYNNLSNMRAAWTHIYNAPRTTIIDNYAIRDIHQMLCQNTDNTRGGLYRLQPTIALRRQSPNYATVLYRMNDIEYKLSPDYRGDKTPLFRALDIHSDLIETQAFDDFNKRTARLIMNWYLMQNDYTPILFTQPSDNKKYMQYLRNSADGDKDSYYEYMLEKMLFTQRALLGVMAKYNLGQTK